MIFIRKWINRAGNICTECGDPDEEGQMLHVLSQAGASFDSLENVYLKCTIHRNCETNRGCGGDFQKRGIRTHVVRRGKG